VKGKSKVVFLHLTKQRKLKGSFGLQKKLQKKKVDMKKTIKLFDS